MKTTEVRRGNLFIDTLTGTILSVDGITDKVISFSQPAGEIKLPDGWQADPIPITPNILEKAGFKSREDDSIFDLEIGQNSIIFKNGTIYLCGGYAVFSQCFEIINIKFLHELQNIVFFISGQEITITI